MNIILRRFYALLLDECFKIRNSKNDCTQTPRPDTPRPDIPRPDTPRPDTPRPDTPCPDTPRPDIPRPDFPPSALYFQILANLVQRSHFPRTIYAVSA